MDEEQMMEEIKAEMPGLLRRIERILDDEDTPVSLSDRDWSMVHAAVGAYIMMLED
jgi:hypothetical protein